MKQQNFESRHFTNVAQNWISSNYAYTQKELPGDALVTVPQSDERVHGDHSYSKDASADVRSGDQEHRWKLPDVSSNFFGTQSDVNENEMMEIFELELEQQGFPTNNGLMMPCVPGEGIQAESNVRREQVGYWTETGTAPCDALQPQHTDNGSTYSLIFDIDDPLG